VRVFCIVINVMILTDSSGYTVIFIHVRRCDCLHEDKNMKWYIGKAGPGRRSAADNAAQLAGQCRSCSRPIDGTPARTAPTAQYGRLMRPP
jgi:hypothetical protein